MDLMKWDESFSVHVKDLDDQHKELVVLINTLHSAMKEGKGQSVTGEIIRGMADYAVLHFETEEKYFDEFNYENTEEHKEEHAKFIKEVADVQKKVEEGSLSVSIELMNFLVDWLENHIKVSDQKYVECFKEHGLI